MLHNFVRLHTRILCIQLQDALWDLSEQVPGTKEEKQKVNCNSLNQWASLWEPDTTAALSFA